MVRKCSICGNPEISLYWSPKCGTKAYCSFGCNLIGIAGRTFLYGIIMFIATIISVIVYSQNPADSTNAMISAMFCGISALIAGLLSAIGYFLKRSS